jgi:prepilin-type N-terminal cleavage/methylation domain-containing protein
MRSIPHRRTDHKDGGFTVLELLVVIAIIAILVALLMIVISTARDRSRLAAAQTQWKSVTSSGLVGAQTHLDLNEGSGFTARSQGIDNPPAGVITNGTWVSDGPTGKPALSLAVSMMQGQPTGGFVSIGTVTVPQSVTIAAWIRTSSSGTQTVFSNRSGGGDIFFGVAGGKFYLASGIGQPAEMTSRTSIDDNKWHYVVWSSDGLISKMYIDGALDSQQSLIRSASSGYGSVGMDAVVGAYFNGQLTQLGIYNQVLGR